MSFIDDAINELHTNRDRKLSGKLNSIPFGLKRLEHYVPGVQHSNYVIVTANSGIGKTKLTKNMYVFKPYDFCVDHPEADIRFNCLYFLLEETAKAFIQSLICYKLRERYKIRISIKELRSQLDPEDKTKVVDLEILRLVDELKPYLEEFSKSVILIDNVRRPYAIFRKCVEHIETLGEYDHVLADVFDPETKTVRRKLVKGKFVFDDPNLYFQVVIDHASLVEPEKDYTLFESIRMLSSTYLLQLRNRFGCSIVLVQQQSPEKEKQQYTYKGASIEAKLEPSLDGLGDCKLTQRDADEAIGLFAPDRYEISDHRGYDIGILGDNYRGISVLKCRDGEANLREGLFFDGATNYLAELPRSSEMMKEHYDKVLRSVGRA